MKIIDPKSTRNNQLLYNRVFIAGLLMLALNDHYLKLHYAGWLTGKLSDFAGLLIFPMFLLYLFPRLGTRAVWLAGALFVWWKLPLSDGFIRWYNTIAPIKICRTVDPADLMALTVLPVSRYCILHIQRFVVQIVLHPVLLLLPASLAFMATSPPRSMYFRPGGDVLIDKSFKTGVTKEVAFEKLKAAGYVIKVDTLSGRDREWYNKHHWPPDTTAWRDSTVLPSQPYVYAGFPEMYRLENIVLPDTKDTIDYILFNCRDNYLYVEHIKFRNKVQLANWRTLRMYTKHYKKVLRSELVKEIRTKRRREFTHQGNQ